MVHRPNMRPESFHAYRGRELEADLLGEIEMSDPRYREELRKLRGPQESYVPYRQAMELVKKFQPGEGARNPRKDFLRELRLAVADKLGLESDAELENLGAYTAVGTPLDFFHGVDGFIAYIKPHDEEQVVTFDVTLERGKVEEGGKADIIIGDLPSPDESEKAYLAAIDQLAKEVVRIMKLREAY